MNITLVNDIDAIIAKTLKSGSAFSADLHLAAFNCVHHVEANGDVRPLNKLFDGLSSSAQNTLKVWAVHFGKVKFDPDLLGFKLNRSIDVVAPELLAEREVVGPMEYKKALAPKKVKTFNLAMAIVDLIKKAEKENCKLVAIQYLTVAMQSA